jgi:hypothetical protein
MSGDVQLQGVIRCKALYEYKPHLHIRARLAAAIAQYEIAHHSATNTLSPPKYVWSEID